MGQRARNGSGLLVAASAVILMYNGIIALCGKELPCSQRERSSTCGVEGSFGARGTRASRITSVVLCCTARMQHAELVQSGFIWIIGTCRLQP